MPSIHNFCHFFCYLWSYWSSMHLQPRSSISYTFDQHNFYQTYPCAYRYSALLWFFPIGFFAPIPFYLLARRFPFSIWRYINIPAFFGVFIYMPQVSPINYSSGLLCGFIFNYIIRRFHIKWWMQYNYVLAFSLDSGAAIALIVIFFTLTLPKKGGIEFNWWGNMFIPTLHLDLISNFTSNSVWTNTADYNGIPFKPLPESGFIGPAKWS